MKLRKEFLIGIIVIIISIAMFYTIRFIQGSNLFSDSIIVHASYPKINNLQVGNPIYINGLKIGLITDTRISNDSDAHIDVDLTLETKYPIPNDSKAEIMELGLMGSMAMDIVLGKSKTPLVNGDRIHASIRSGMMTKVQEQISPIVDQSGAFISKIDTALTEYTKVAQNLNRIIKDIEIEQKLKHIDNMVLSFTETSNNAQLALANFSELSDSLKQIEFGKVVNNLNTLLVSSEDLMQKIKSPEGSVNKLLTQPELYDNLKNSTESLDILLKDLKANPKRYVHFSVFGKKDKSKK
ncbi:MAG: MlaD family protein [Flavobacteriales bacterium]